MLDDLDDDKPRGPQPYTGRASELRDSPWLAGEDLQGLGEVTAEIEDVLLYPSVVFEAGRVKKNVAAIKFKGRDKQLVLSAGVNRKTLAELFGQDTRKWRGKMVKLWFDPSVLLGKIRKGGLRVKAA